MTQVNPKFKAVEIVILKSLLAREINDYCESTKSGRLVANSKSPYVIRLRQILLKVNKIGIAEGI